MERMVKWALKSLTAVCAIILFALSLISLLIQPRVTLDYEETVSFVHNGPLFILQTLLIILCLFFLRRLFESVRPLHLFLILESFWLAGGVFLIEGLDHSKIRADQDSVYQNALLFNQGDFSALKPGNYLNRYQFQLGLVSLERIPAALGLRVHGLLYLNLVMILGIQFLMWRILKLLFHPSRVDENYTLLLSFLFLPVLLYTMFLYGQIPGLFFFLSAFFCVLRYLKDGRTPEAVCSVILITLACVAKQNYKVGAIAMVMILALYFILDFSRQRISATPFPDKKRLFGTMILVIMIPLCVTTTDRITIRYYENMSGYEIIGGTPMLLNVAMGLQESTPTALGGWYNEYNWNTYEMTGFDSERSKEIALENIRDSISVYVSDPPRFMRFYTYKIASSWNDPTFGGIWIGPRPSQGQSLPGNRILRSLYLGGFLYERLEDLLCSLLIILYLCAALCPFILMRRLSLRERTLESLFFLYFLGGFIFHSFSEICGKYVFIYVFCLIPYSGITLSRLISGCHVPDTKAE